MTTTSPAAGSGRRPTSQDVARLAGLSRSAVSQILNGNGERFARETRDRVTAAAASLGYRPSRAGRALVSGLSDIIVLAVPNVSFGRHLQDAVDQIANSSAAIGKSVVVRYLGEDPAASLTAVLDLRPAAVIDFAAFGTEERETIRAAGVRLVPDVSEDVRAAFVDPNLVIGRLQAEELLRSPERRLIYAAMLDERSDVFGPARAQGAAEAARAAGCAEPTIVHIPLRLEAAIEILEPVFADAGRTSFGVCCFNDDVAIAVLAVARHLGLSVPEQVAVVGVDRTAVGQLVTPRLTTVDVDLAAVIRLLTGDGAGLRGGGAIARAGLPDLESFVSLVPGETS